MRRARFWLFISYIVSFASIVAAVWVMLEHYSADETLSGSEKWPGPAGIFQVGVGCCTPYAAARFALLAIHRQARARESSMDSVCADIYELAQRMSSSRHVCMHGPGTYGLKTNWSMGLAEHNANTPAMRAACASTAACRWCSYWAAGCCSSSHARPSTGTATMGTAASEACMGQFLP